MWTPAAVMAACWLWSAPAAAQLVATEVSGAASADAAVTLTLSWSQPVQITVEPGPNELVVRADQPIDHTGFTAVAPQLTAWVRGLFLGYDSLVLTLEPGVTVRTEHLPNGVALKFTMTAGQDTAARPAPALLGPKDRTDRERLQFLKAVLLWSTGEVFEAGELLAALGQSRPEDVEVLAARSLVETRLGRWRLASAHLERGLTLQGKRGRGALPIAGDPNAPAARLEALRDRQDGQPDRAGLRLGGHAFVLPGLRATLAYELAHLAGVSHQQATVGGRHDLRSGSWLSAQAHLRARHLGLATSGELWDRFGATRLSLSWQEPRWELPVLVRLGATRDAVGLQRQWRSWGGLGRALGGDVSGQIEAHLERWRSEDAPSDLQDVFAAGTLRYASWFTRPRLWAEYTIVHLQVLSGAAGDMGQAVARSHSHACTVGATISAWSWLQIVGFAGYSLSLWGPDAALFGAEVAWQPPSGLRTSAHYRRGQQAATRGTATDALGLNVGWSF